MKRRVFIKKKQGVIWGIENKLHWVLDVIFQEDAGIKRYKNASQNFSLINKVALNIIKMIKQKHAARKEKDE